MARECLFASVGLRASVRHRWLGSAGAGASIRDRWVVDATIVIRSAEPIEETVEGQTTRKEESVERLATGESVERLATKDRERRFVSVGVWQLQSSFAQRNR